MRAAIAVLAVVTFTMAAAAPVRAADDAKVNAATKRLETGAKTLGSGNVRDGAISFGRGVKRFLAHLFRNDRT